MNIIRRNLPNLLTCLNVLSGCVAIVLAFSPYEVMEGIERWRWAALALGVAVAADFLDGFTARLLKAWSAVGKELDSLSDLVSFGVAPAMLLLNMLAQKPGVATWLPWVALIIPVAGAMRLARFNVDPRQSSSFIGLPIPANAIFWLGYAALVAASDCQWLCSPALVIPLVILESWLMVAPIPLFSLKFHNYGWKGNACRWILIFGAAGLICWLGLQGLIPVILLYLFLSIFDRSGKEE